MKLYIQNIPRSHLVYYRDLSPLFRGCLLRPQILPGLKLILVNYHQDCYIFYSDLKFRFDLNHNHHQDNNDSCHQPDHLMQHCNTENLFHNSEQYYLSKPSQRQPHNRLFLQHHHIPHPDILLQLHC